MSTEQITVGELTATLATGTVPRPPRAPGSDATPSFTRVEDARIRYAVEDWAANYGRVSADPTRYITEGHLAEVVARHGYEPVYAAVRALLEREPGHLSSPTTEAERAERARKRHDAASELGHAAVAAIGAGDYRRAMWIVADAEALAPGLMPWDRIRDRIRAQREAAQTPPEAPA
jgi:hypothetical protein